MNLYMYYVQNTLVVLNRLSNAAIISAVVRKNGSVFSPKWIKLWRLVKMRLDFICDTLTRTRKCRQNVYLFRLNVKNAIKRLISGMHVADHTNDRAIFGVHECSIEINQTPLNSIFIYAFKLMSFFILQFS